MSMAVNGTCPLEPAFQTVNSSSYNWTKAWDEWSNDDGGNSQGKTELQDLWAVNVDGSGQQAKLPGCFILGTLNRTQVEACEGRFGGMAILNSRTKQILDADVWFCGFQGGSNHGDNDAINSRVRDLYSSNALPIITCNTLKSAAPRVTWSWAPMLLVGLTSFVALL